MNDLSKTLSEYSEIVGSDVVGHLFQLASPLKGMRVVHINSTRMGGGVAEILYKMVPLMNDLGAPWPRVVSSRSRRQKTTSGKRRVRKGNLDETL